MPASQASRRLVKSPPELWAEVSDAASLAKHLGEVGQIRIIRLEPETTVAWEGEHASGTVELAPAGWGTSVTFTAEPVGEPAPEPEPATAEAEAATAEPEPATEMPAAVADGLVADEPVPAAPRRSWLSRLFRREPVGVEPAAPPADPEPAAPESVADEPEPGPDPEPAVPDPLEAVLTGALDSLGAAHHRPFSRG